MPLSVGIHPGVRRAEYEAIEAINISTLEHFDRTDLHGQWEMLHKKPPSRAMEVGTHFHMNLLEPGRFEREYVIPPKVDRRFKEQKMEWERFEAENVGKSYVDAEAHVQIIGMRDAVWARPIASALLSGRGLSEVAIVWDDPETGIRCKGLLDRLSEYAGWTWITDLKSCRDASREGFSLSCKKLRYGARAAYYFDGCNVLAPRDRRFAWIAVENTAPFCVAEYEADESALQRGRERYRRWLRRYWNARETGVWQGYPDEIQVMTSSETEWRSRDD